MKIALIDFDSKIPNLALMKLSSHYKSKGHEVILHKFDTTAYPKKNKKTITFDASGYSRVCASIIFTSNKDKLNIVNCNKVDIGGTGFDLKKELPENIDDLEPDYSLYPENNISYGFITRGCIRNCYFCFVPKKEGKIRRYRNIDDIVRHDKVCFMDNNILGWHEHKKIFQEILDKKLHLTFNQGLDIRLIDEENARLLSEMNYMGEYIFAFDDISYQPVIEEKYAIVRKYIKSDWRTKFYVYCHPKMAVREIRDRIDWCMENKALPYIMRDFECFDSENKNFYTDIASWCNQPGLFKNMSFEEFVNKRSKNQERVSKTLELWDN